MKKRLFKILSEVFFGKGIYVFSFLIVILHCQRTLYWNFFIFFYAHVKLTWGGGGGRGIFVFRRHWGRGGGGGENKIVLSFLYSPYSAADFVILDVKPTHLQLSCL
ncbi:hypothetical protein EGW08_012821 [Elysia chlorotica]|uniref:Uncharacterized protein n=1 Tax=Elysia chlorotica TaxID=188477 RepID=A0A3S0ZI49_ELYCH|nr:hypothetical protein EGW08_012821 [Elysia chlorotica]